MTSHHQLIEAWTAGWAHSRGTPSPQARAYGFELQVGLPGHWARHVLPRLDADHIQALAARLNEPGVFLKVCAPADPVATLLPSDWAVTAVNTLMSTALDRDATPAACPEGFEISLAPRLGAVLSIRVNAGENLAATGRVGLHGAYAVFDQIETSPSFQRRGLGRLVMNRLSHAALAAGATRGVLAATDEGRWLYTALGWRSDSPLTTAARPSAAAVNARLSAH